ncbi:glycosyltransferase family 4 protein [bacterium]|nr:glycosyltransferase family 4 protein [bacterium]
MNPVSSKPKILLCISSSRWGGGERHVFDLIKGLSPQFEFTLLYEPGGVLEEEAHSLGIDLIPHSFSEGTLIKRCSSLLAKIKEGRFDGIHTHLNQASFQTSLLRPLIKKPLLATVHGFSSLLYYALPHHLIAVSKAIETFLSPWYDDKTSCIYNGLNQEPMQPKEDSEGIPNTFVFATIHPNKGQTFVVEACLSTPPTSKITFVGRGSKKHENKLKRLTNLGEAKSRFEWIQKIGDLESYWEVADFIIVPSYKEALSYVALEAQVRNIPVLASRTGGLKEIITEGEGGLYFEPGNQGSFRRSLLEMEKRHREFKKHLQANPFLEQNPQFQMQTMLEKTKEIYKIVFNLKETQPEN